MSKKHKCGKPQKHYISLQQGNDEKTFLNAARAGHTDAVTRLLARRTPRQELIDKALCTAAAGGYLSVVKALLAHGADVHTEEDRPLRFAAANGRAPVVAELLRAGAYVHAQRDQALVMAVAFSQDYETVAILLRRGADARAKDRGTGSSALGIAAVNGKLNIVERLLANGADPQSVSVKTRRWILSYGNPEVLARIMPEQDQQYALESDYIVSKTDQLPDAKFSLKRLFDFRAREVTTLANDDRVTVQSFDQVSKQSVDDARKALNRFHQQKYGNADILNFKDDQSRISPELPFLP